MSARISSASRPTSEAGSASSRVCHPVLVPAQVQAPGGQVELGVEFVQVPAQPVLRLGAHLHQVLPVVDQQLQLPGGMGVLRPRQIRLAQRRPGDGQCVDRIGLAPGPRARPGPGHQLRRHPHHRPPRRPAAPAPGGWRRAGSPPRQTPLSSANSRRAQRSSCRCPASVARTVNGCAQLPAHLIDRDRAVGLLVDVDPNHDHHEGVSSLPEKGRLGRPADTPQWGRSHAPIKSRRSALTSGDRHNAWMPAPRRGGSDRRSQITTGQDPNHRNQMRRSAP